MNTVYLQIYFVTIACILGTGILGLPVTLYKCGFYPFLVLFMIAFVMQTLVIFIGVEILQKAHAVQVKYLKEAAKDVEDPPSNSSDKMSEITSETQTSTESETKSLNFKERLNADTYDDPDDNSENGDHAILSKQNAVRPPDLHLLGELFLGYGFKYVFDILIIFEVVTLLIAFSLAGSEAYGELLQIKYIYIIPVFIWCLAIIIIFAIKLIQPIVSILTFFKATLFSLAVFVTFVVTSGMQADAENNFNYIQDSLLMAIVTLGGAFLVMPFLYGKIENDATQVVKYRIAVVMGLVTCTILFILWCWAVFDIVPQRCHPVIGTNQSLHDPVICNSLQSAQEEGQISTVPLTKIIRHKDPAFIWVATVIEVFIIISITVSYLTIGTVMHHIIHGIVESHFSTCFSFLGSKRKTKLAQKCTAGFISFILFVIIFIIAMLNPKGFLQVMEKFTSVAVNAMNVLVFMIFANTRNKENMKVKIPLPLPDSSIPLFYVLPIYFGFAVVYDIYISVMFYMHH